MPLLKLIIMLSFSDTHARARREREGVRGRDGGREVERERERERERWIEKKIQRERERKKEERKERERRERKRGREGGRETNAKKVTTSVFRTGECFHRNIHRCNRRSTHKYLSLNTHSVVITACYVLFL